MAPPLSRRTQSRLPTVRSAMGDAEDFDKSVQDGLRLSKRIYFGTDRSVNAPKPVSAMEKSPESLIPTSPMIYAVVPDPRVVDNPDVPSYQPHVHGRCDPPALMPLQMNGILLEADCYLDTAFITLTGSWRVHCVAGCRQCDCRIAIPMGEQGSILGVEIDLPGKSYCTQFVGMEYKKEPEKLAKSEDGGFLKPHIFTLTIPQVDGGSNLSLKVKWSQKLLYDDGQITLNVPFSFPDFVIPAGKIMTKIEKIQLNVCPGPGADVQCRTLSHPLKEVRREGGMVGFLHESQVVAWSTRDVTFTYSVSNQHTGGLLLQSPSPLDADQRDMFCFYLFPGTGPTTKIFRKNIVFIVDISESMSGKPIEETRNAVVAAISKLDSEDSFNVIAFNHDTQLFSSSLQFATEQNIDNATQWMSTNFIADGDTDMLLPLTQAVKMLSKSSSNSIPMIFLITDGAVDDERNICEIMRSHIASQELKINLRIYTFGIGSFCNHYFLRMLALIGRGHHYASYDADLIEVRLETLFSRASSTILANIELDGLEGVDKVEVNPCDIPDLSAKSGLVISGRFQGTLPETVIAKGILADGSDFFIDLDVLHNKDVPLERVLAKQLIDEYTAHAWFLESKELEEKVEQISERTSFLSEYTHMIMLEFEKEKDKETGKMDKKPAEQKEGEKIKKTDDAASEEKEKKTEDEVAEAEKKTETEEKKGKEKEKEKDEHEEKNKRKSDNCTRIIAIQSLGAGFGDLQATLENTPPGSETLKLPEAAEKFVKAASSCCDILCGCWCCPCCISVCSRMNDQCALVLTQLCGALACLGCLSCCELCCNGQDS